MAELKTKRTEADVHEFINSFADTEQKRADSFELLKLMQDVTGHEAKMWGPSMIGFGSYHYKSERSKQEGDWPLTGFSPRKQNLTIYIMNGFEKYTNELTDLGKHNISKSCLYIKRLSDIDITVLQGIRRDSAQQMKQT